MEMGCLPWYKVGINYYNIGSSAVCFPYININKYIYILYILYIYIYTDMRVCVCLDICMYT